jgi:hypothetical protein
MKDVKLILVLALGFIIAVAQFDSSGSKFPISEFVGSASGGFSITDGDTIKMNGESKGTRRCHHLSQITEAAKCIAPRNVDARLS